MYNTSYSIEESTWVHTDTHTTHACTRLQQPFQPSQLLYNLISENTYNVTHFFIENGNDAFQTTVFKKKIHISLCYLQTPHTVPCIRLLQDLGFQPFPPNNTTTDRLVLLVPYPNNICDINSNIFRLILRQK